MQLEIEFFPYPVFIGTVLLIAMIIRKWRMDHSWPYLLFFSILWVYFLVILKIIFFPIRIPEDWPGSISVQNTLDTLSRINLIPLYFGNLFTTNAAVIFRQFIGNIFLTMPFGFLLPFLVRVPARRGFLIALFTGLALEGAQSLISLLSIIGGYGHSIDINDVILNAIGVIIGFGGFRSFIWLYRILISRFQVPTNDLFQFIHKVTLQ